MESIKDDRLKAIVEAVDRIADEGKDLLLIYDVESSLQKAGSKLLVDAFEILLASFQSLLAETRTNRLKSRSIPSSPVRSLGVFKNDPVEFDASRSEDRMQYVLHDNDVAKSVDLNLRPREDIETSELYEPTDLAKPLLRTEEIPNPFIEHNEQSWPSHQLSGSRSKANSRNKSRLLSTYRSSFVCATCGRAFRTKCAITVHERTHTGFKPFVCDICGKGFGVKSNLNVHRTRHSLEKPFSCETCGKTFTRKMGLREHQRVHTGEKPYKCETCPAAFAVVQNLKVHRAMHEGLRPFQCDQCGRNFPRKANLVIHERSHSKDKPFFCPICPKRFSQASCLKRHQKVHNGQKPCFKCECCGKAFSTKHYLTIHERTHTGERPYHCRHDGCESSFNQKRYLDLHQRLHFSSDRRRAINRSSEDNCESTQSLDPTTVQSSVLPTDTFGD